MTVRLLPGIKLYENAVVSKKSASLLGEFYLEVDPGSPFVQDDLGAANVEIEVVAYGPGIGMLKLDAVTNSRVTDAIKAGIQVAACENTMRNQKLARADMHPNVSYVPAGVVEIVRRQQEGWAYLRP